MIQYLATDGTVLTHPIEGLFWQMSFPVVLIDIALLPARDPVNKRANN